jgi:hypothetical protein
VAIPLSDRVPGRASAPSRSQVNDGGGSRCVSGKLIGYLGFSRRGVFIGEGAMSEVQPGGLTPGWRDPGPGHAGLVCGAPMAPFLLLFGSLEAPGQNKTSGTCFVQFQEYFLCITSETQKQQKIGNWYCGNLLIG